MVRLMVQPAMFPFARFDIAGTENIPSRGPAIVAANHRSYFDPLAYGLAVFNAGRNPTGPGQEGDVRRPDHRGSGPGVGAICVDRKGSGRRAYEQAEQALRGGEVLIVTPQGTIPRGEAFFDPKLRGKSGAARLAAATGAPVIPLGIWGSEEVWPRSSRLPNVTGVLHPPTVRVRVGPPVRGLTGEDFGADTERIMAAITAQLPAGGESAAHTDPRGVGPHPATRFASGSVSEERPGTDPDAGSQAGPGEDAPWLGALSAPPPPPPPPAQDPADQATREGPVAPGAGPGSGSARGAGAAAGAEAPPAPEPAPVAPATAGPTRAPVGPFPADPTVATEVRSPPTTTGPPATTPAPAAGVPGPAAAGSAAGGRPPRRRRPPRCGRLRVRAPAPARVTSRRRPGPLPDRALPRRPQGVPTGPSFVPPVAGVPDRSGRGRRRGGRRRTGRVGRPGRPRPGGPGGPDDQGPQHGGIGQSGGGHQGRQPGRRRRGPAPFTVRARFGRRRTGAGAVVVGGDRVRFPPRPESLGSCAGYHLLRYWDHRLGRCCPAGRIDLGTGSTLAHRSSGAGVAGGAGVGFSGRPGDGVAGRPAGAGLSRRRR